MHDHGDRLTLTIEEAAVRLGISRKHAYELAATDRLPVPTIRLGRRVVVSRLALGRVLASESPDADEHNDHAA